MLTVVHVMTNSLGATTTVVGRFVFMLTSGPVWYGRNYYTSCLLNMHVGTFYFIRTLPRKLCEKKRCYVVVERRWGWCMVAVQDSWCRNVVILN